jgi:hypothetical protein
LTHPAVPVPTRLVSGVADLVVRLDAHGAGLADTYGAAGLGVLAERAAALMLGRSGRLSCGGATRLVAAGDGWVALTLARPDDRVLLPAWLGLDVESPWSSIERRVAQSPSADLVETATLLGIACAAVGERPPIDSTPALIDGVGGVPPRSITGLRVVNLASLWAGPLCAEVMVRLGADVVCVESTRRPDGGRATPTWFDSIHAGQRSAAFDFRSPSDVERLHRLLAGADVVIEGSRPRALAQLGISSERLVSTGPQVWVAITAHGRSGDAAMRVGYGDDAAAAGGLVGWIDDAPVFLVDAVADPMSGLVAADSIVELVTAGHRAIVDVALSRVAASMANRHGDPVVAPLPRSAAPSCPRPPAPPFVLGADTDEVLAEWT